MASVKSDRADYEKLLNGIDPVQPQQQASSQTSTVVDTPPTAADTFNEPLFEFQYDETRKGYRKKARKTILSIVDHIIPKDIIDEDYIQNKMEQDIDTLTGLYMQVEVNTVMQRSLMDQVSMGVSPPRMYEVFTQLTDKIQAINKQIVDTEQKIRKTYTDLKFEIREKMTEEASPVSQPSNQLGISETPNGIMFSDTKNLNNAVLEMKKRKALENSKEVKFTEVK